MLAGRIRHEDHDANRGELVARFGPFVMTTRSELQQAFDDFRRGAFLD